MYELKELPPVRYYDTEKSISLTCYADTLVYHKASKVARELVGIHFGGYPEHVRGLADVLRKDAAVETEVDGHPIVLQARQKAYKRTLSHDGIYAESTLMAIDDEIGEQEENDEVERPNQKRRMYIFCEEGDTDALFAEVDRKTAIPLIPAFKDYVLSELQRWKILVPLEVLSVGRRFDAYMLEVSREEKEVEAVINEGLKTGAIAIPNAAAGADFREVNTVSQYLNKFGVTIADRIKNLFHPMFDPAHEDICKSLKEINANLKQNVGYSLYPAQLAVAEAVKRRLDKSKGCRHCRGMRFGKNEDWLGCAGGASGRQKMPECCAVPLAHDKEVGA